VPKYTKEEEAGGSLSKKQAIGKATGRFCTKCGAILYIQTAAALQDEMESLDGKLSTILQDEDVLRLLVKKMIELGIK